MEIETISRKCKSLSFLTPTFTRQLHATKAQYNNNVCIMLYVFIVAQTITNTTRLSHVTKIHCVCCPLHVLPLNFRHIESVLIVFHTLTIFVVVKHRMVPVQCMQPACKATQR